MSGKDDKTRLRPEIPRERILRIVAYYAAFSALWILLSDMALEKLLPDARLITVISAFKGWLFVGITAVLLYGVLHRLSVAPAASTTASRFHPYLTSIVLVVLIGAVTAATAYLVLDYYEKEQVVRLRAIAELKARQVSAQLGRLGRTADHISREVYLVDLYRQWRDGDKASGEALQGHLDLYIDSNDFDYLALLDAQANLLWQAGANEKEPASHLVAIAQEAATRHAVTRAIPTGHSTDDPVHLNYVVPLYYADTLQAYVVLRADVQDWFDNTLQPWPEPTRNGDVVLFRHDGGNIQFLNTLRHTPSATPLRFSPDDRVHLAAKVLQSKVDEGDTISGLDYANRPAIGVVRSIPGTDWHLLAEVRRTDILSEATKGIIWTILTGLMTLALALTGLASARQQRRLAIAEATRESQAQRLQALDLLEAVLEGTDDPVFAYDTELRFTLFNRAAERATGVPAEQVLGRDEQVVLPQPMAAAAIQQNRDIMANGQPVEMEAELNGRVFQSRKSLLRDREGRIVGLLGIARDITRLKRAERDLAEREARYRAVIETSGDGFWMLDIRGRILMTNEAFVRRSGYSLNEVVGMHVSDFDVEEDPEAVMRHMEKIRRDGHDNFETRFRARDGAIWPVEILASSWPDNGGTIFTFVRDISARKAAEEALRSSEERLRMAQQAAQIGSFEWTPADDSNVWSPEMEAIHGLEPGGFRGTRSQWEELLHPDDRRWVLQEIGASMRDGKSRQDEWRIVWPDGSVHWVAARWQFILDQQGVPLRMLGTNVDITEKKLDQEKLRISEANLREAQKLASLAHWKWDLTADVRYWSEELYLIFGLDPDQPVPSHPQMQRYFTPQSWRLISAAVESCVSEGTPYSRDLEVIRPDGEHRWILSRGEARRDASGNIIELHGTVQDISERKTIERSLVEKTRELRARNSELERFNRAMVDREMVMIDLKKEVNALSQELGREPPHPLDFLEPAKVRPGDE